MPRPARAPKHPGPQLLGELTPGMLQLLCAAALEAQGWTEAAASQSLAWVLERPLPGGHPAWRLGLQASALSQPGQKRMVGLLSRTQRLLRVEGGLETMEAELPAQLEQPELGRRTLRRNAVLLSWRLVGPGASERHASAAGWHGFVAGGTMRMWLRYGARPVLDSQVALDVATPTATRLQQQVWAHVGWRGLVGGDEALLRSGGLRLPGPVLRAEHVLHEDVPGYEDHAQYTARLVRAQAGAGMALTAASRVDVFAAATQLDALTPRPGRWRRALGLSVRVWRGGRRSAGPSLSYQVAHRLDGSRGPWLHMLTASL